MPLGANAGRAYGQNSSDSSGRGRSQPEGRSAQDPQRAKVLADQAAEKEQNHWDRAKIVNALLQQRQAAVAKDQGNDSRLATAQQIRDASIADLKGHQIELDRALNIDPEYRKESPWGQPPENWKPKGSTDVPRGTSSTPKPSPVQGPTETGATEPVSGTDRLLGAMRSSGMPLNDLQRTGAGFQTTSTATTGPNGLPGRSVSVTPQSDQILSAERAARPDLDWDHPVQGQEKLGVLQSIMGPPVGGGVRGTTTDVGAVTPYNAKGERTVAPGAQTSNAGPGAAAYAAAGGTEYNPLADTTAGRAVDPTTGRITLTGIPAKYLPAGAPQPLGAVANPAATPSVPAGTMMALTPQQTNLPGAPQGTGARIAMANGGLTTESTAPQPATLTPSPSPVNPARPGVIAGQTPATGFTPSEQPGAFSQPVPPVSNPVGSGTPGGSVLSQLPDKSDATIAGESTRSAIGDTIHSALGALGDRINEAHDYFKGLVPSSGDSGGLTAGTMKSFTPPVATGY